MGSRVPADQTVLGRAISAPDAVNILGEKGIKISERGLKERARQIGAYRQIGKAMFFLDEDLRKIMEPSQCSNSSSAPAKARIGLRGGPSTVDALSEARAKLRKRGHAKHLQR